MNTTTLLTKRNKLYTHTQKHNNICIIERKRNKKKKIILSSLFNSYFNTNTKEITNKKWPYAQSHTNIITEIITFNIKRTLLWLGKEYDINSLYPWTQQQLKISKPTLNIMNKKDTHENYIIFFTNTNNSKWTTHTRAGKSHYKLSFYTNTKINKTKQQLNLKYLTNNKEIKNTINKQYGKWTTQTIKRAITRTNNTDRLGIIEHRKLKLNTNAHIRRERLDTKNTSREGGTKIQKKKIGHQKNELLNTFNIKKDNFKACNIIHYKKRKRKIHTQQHRKLKY